MTSSNIKQTCESNGLVATCACADDTICTETALTVCDMPMTALSQELCGEDFPGFCEDLQYVFIYFTLWGWDGVGASDEGWIAGDSYQDGFALCAEGGGKLI